MMEFSIMALKKILKYAIIFVTVALLLGMVGLFFWSQTGTYPARSVAQAAIESTGDVTVSQDQFIIFSPAEETQTGLIFYPGGLVEPAAYAPVLSDLAEENILVVITPMPFNLAIFGSGAAQNVIDDYPYIDRWILAGHSLGGAAAAIFADNHPEQIDAVVFWDSYPPNSASLADDALPVLSIFGTTNGIPNTDSFEDKQNLLPDDTSYIPIEGASHAQFGDYGPQKGDVSPSISLSAQHDQIFEIMLDFINSIN